LVDSWATYNDREAIRSVTPEGNEFEILQIPPKTTAVIQPLDVYFFRTWKDIAKRFYDHVLLHNLNINLHHRDNILKLQSLIHNQFSSPRFKNSIKYAWFKARLLDSRPKSFQNCSEFCFRNLDSHCLTEMCDVISFIRCGCCKNSFCFCHFFNDYHFCETYVN